MTDRSLDIASIRAGYLDNAFSVSEVIDDCLDKAAALEAYHIWIRRFTRHELADRLSALEALNPADYPLYGIPFAIKDNIDIAGIPTTAACPAYSYIPQHSSTAVQRLLDAGAVLIGKTNLDQFATGLNGTRSPYGATKNSFNPDYISGGSSSGSAVAVALGLVSFALGTDTAGSGRVPAAFNNLIGIKPTRGLVSTAGVVPACRSLDCVSVLALTVTNGMQALQIMQGQDPNDAFSRTQPSRGKAVTREFTVGVPQADQLTFFGDAEAQHQFSLALEQLKQAGARLQPIDLSPFLQAATLLYQGPWVAERYAAIEAFIETQAEALLPVIRDIILPAKNLSAVAQFKATYALQDLKRRADAELHRVDCIVTPTAGKLYTIEEMLANPIQLNTELGTYTNFMNLLDYSAIALPAGFTSNGLPFGITLFGEAWSDQQLAIYAQWYLNQATRQLGATDVMAPPEHATLTGEPPTIDLAVCGAHLSGMPLNGQLKERDAKLLCKTKTAAAYRFYALAGGPPFRPGLVRDAQHGKQIDLEVWRIPAQHFASFVQLIPHPLGIGTVELVDGSWVKSFICEPCALTDAKDITELGNWRAFMTSLR